MKKIAIAAISALGLVSASTAFAAPAQSLRASQYSSPAQSLSVARAGAPMRKASKFGSGNGLGIALLAVVLAGAAYGAYELINGDNNDNPASN